MLGLLGQRSRGASAGGSPAGDLIPDPNIDMPGAWDLNSPAAASIAAGIMTSTTGDSASPVSTLLTAPTAAGASYRIEIDEATSGEMLYRVRLRNSGGGGGEQLIVSAFDSGMTPRSVTFTASSVFDQLRIAFHDVGIGIDRVSLQPVAP